MYSFLARETPGTLRAILWPIPSVVCSATDRRRSFPSPSRRVAGIPEGDGVQGLAYGISGGPTAPPRHRAVRRRRLNPCPDGGSLHAGHRAPLLRPAAARRRGRPAPGLGGLAPDVDPSGRLATPVAAFPTERQRADSLVEESSGAWNGPTGDCATPTPTRRSIWQALFTGAGRWSSERNRTGGACSPAGTRRATRNPRALTQGERDVLACAVRGHSNKYIGYLLGVATSTAATRLDSAPCASWASAPRAGHRGARRCSAGPRQSSSRIVPLLNRPARCPRDSPGRRPYIRFGEAGKGPPPPRREGRRRSS